MIARIWHGRTPAEKADAYFDFLNTSGIPDYKATDGNRGVYALRRLDEEANEVHFLLLTLWDSVAAIKRFAGDEIDVARYYDEDKDFLLEFEPNVTHYEVLSQPGEG
jgi:heme-degrading monooxygenase HmoA